MKRPLMVLSIGVALVGPGCSRIAMTIYRPARIAECPGPIPPSSASSGDFTRRLRVHVESGEVSEGYQVIVQKRADRLTVIGLTRFGARAFSIVQIGDQLTVESSLKPIESVPPANVLRDLYRWPLERVETPDDGPVRLLRDPRHNAATLVNEPCGYRTTIVELDHDTNQ